MTAQRGPDGVGSVAEEAGRLLESLRRAGAAAAAEAAAEAAAAAPPTGTAAGSASSTQGHAPGGFRCEDPVCQWCPVCRASAILRRLSPETLDGLAELAGFAAHVLGDLATARARDSASPPADPSRQQPHDG